jgi:hypothetical protein
MSETVTIALSKQDHDLLVAHLQEAHARTRVLLRSPRVRSHVRDVLAMQQNTLAYAMSVIHRGRQGSARRTLPLRPSPSLPRPHTSPTAHPRRTERSPGTGDRRP